MSHPSGPKFGLEHDNKFIFNTKASIDYIHQPPTHEQNETVYVPVDNGNKSTDPPDYEEATVLNVPIDDMEDYYHIQLKNSGDIIDVPMQKIKEINPKKDVDITSNTTKPFPLIPWIHHDAKVTLYLPNMMCKPKQGYLNYNRGLYLWKFQPDC